MLRPLRSSLSRWWKSRCTRSSWGSTPADFKRLSNRERLQFLTSDRQQLEALIAAHQASTDPRWKDIVSYAHDKLRALGNSEKQLHAVFDYARRHGVPVAITLAGGYARRVADTVRIHVDTIVAAREAAEQGSAEPGSKAC